jgi:hypothetical protein
MSIKYLPLESKSGFKSPGFSVSETGDLTVEGTVVFDGKLEAAENFTVGGIQVLDNTTSTVSLGESIVYSSLTRLGTLEFLEVGGDFRVTDGFETLVDISNGQVTIVSTGLVGTLDNVDIGSNIPANGQFNQLVVGSNTNLGTLSVNGNFVVAQNSQFDGEILVNGNISAGTVPTAPSHVTRKDYVDARISAFAIAFGA